MYSLLRQLYAVLQAHGLGKRLALGLVLAYVSVLPSALAQETGWTSDLLERTTLNGRDVRKLKGNVVLTQPDKVLTCDTAIEYLDTKDIVFISRVVLRQNSGETLTGDTLTYRKASRVATMRGRTVQLVNKQTTVTTTELDYSMESGRVTYDKGATIVDGKTTLVSKNGQYDRDKEIFYFTNDVVLKGENNTLTTDTLHYHAKDNLAYFFGPSKVVSKDGTILSTKGRYNTKTEVAKLEAQSLIETDDYIMTAKVLDYDKAQDMGYGVGNVYMYSKKDSSTITGQEGYYNGLKGISKVWGNPLMKSPADKGGTLVDTLYLRADTLIAIGSRKKPELKQRLLAYPHARFFKQNLQAIADSLVYEVSDSLLLMFKDPVVWSAKNQITADTIRALSRNQKLDKVYIRKDAFVVSIDTLGNYNQTKGKNMLAHFNKGKLSKIDVDGNGQSIYWVLDGDTAITGMNRIVCSDMIIRFGTEGKLSKITFINEPDGVFTPPHELKEPEKFLKGFIWRGTERPTLESLTGRKADSAQAQKKPIKAGTKKPTQKAKKRLPNAQKKVSRPAALVPKTSTKK